MPFTSPIGHSPETHQLHSPALRCLVLLCLSVSVLILVVLLVFTTAPVNVPEDFRIFELLLGKHQCF